MGPDTNHLEQVKLDAHKATLRHFENEMRDNDFKPVVPLAEVDKIVRDMLGKNEIEAPAPAEEAPEVEAEAKAEAPAEEAPTKKESK